MFVSALSVALLQWSVVVNGVQSPEYSSQINAATVKNFIQANIIPGSAPVVVSFVAQGLGYVLSFPGGNSGDTLEFRGTINSVYGITIGANAGNETILFRTPTTAAEADYFTTSAREAVDQARAFAVSHNTLTQNAMNAAATAYAGIGSATTLAAAQTLAGTVSTQNGIAQSRAAVAAEVTRNAQAFRDASALYVSLGTSVSVGNQTFIVARTNIAVSSANAAASAAATAAGVQASAQQLVNSDCLNLGLASANSPPSWSRGFGCAAERLGVYLSVSVVILSFAGVVVGSWAVVAGRVLLGGMFGGSNRVPNS